MKNIIILSLFILSSFAVFGQYSLPRSWVSLKEQVTKKSDTSYLDTIYLPGVTKDTVTISVQMSILIAKNGLIKDFKVHRTYITDMEDESVNVRAFKFYEEKVSRLYAYLKKEKVIYQIPQNREFRIFESQTFYVPGKDIYLD